MQQTVNLSSTTDAKNTTSTDETLKPLSIHKVQYMVIPAALDLRGLNLTVARSRFYDLLAKSSLGELQVNCSGLAGNFQSDIETSSSTAPPITSELTLSQISPPTRTRQLTVSIINDSTVLQYDNIVEKNFALGTIRRIWATSFSQFLFHLFFYVVNWRRSISAFSK